MVTMQPRPGEERNASVETLRSDATPSAEDTPEERSIRERLRTEALSKVRSAVSSSKVLTQADLRSYERIVLSEQGLEQGGARTHEEKMRFLQQNVSQYIPQVIADARRMESDFLSAVRSLESAGLDARSAERWRDFLRQDSKLWYQKKGFLTRKFPELQQRWRDLLSEEKRLREKIQRAGKSANDMPEVRAFTDSSYKDAELSRRTAIVNNALAAVAATERQSTVLYRKAQEKLQDAAARGVLAPGKVSVWLKRIFESNADDQLIEDFLNGNGHDSLPSLIDRWSGVREKYDAVEELRKGGKNAPRFHFVSLDVFLNWRYPARVAYVNEAEHRLKEEPGSGKGILLDIRRELDTEDWRSAEALIGDAKAMPLAEAEKRQLRSMEEYLRTQRAESPKTKEEEEHDENPQADMYKALAELKHINGAMYDLYVRAMARGTGALSTLCSLMYNRCWVRGKHIMDDTDEEMLRERAREETKEVVEHGHGKQYENNYIPGYGDASIRNQNQGEWSPQVLHIGSDPSAHEALVSKCDSQQSNYSFKYWSTLIPEGVGYSQHQFIVFNLNWRLKSGLRSCGALSKEKLLEDAPTPAPKPTAKPAKKSESPNQAIAA